MEFPEFSQPEEREFIVFGHGTIKEARMQDPLDKFKKVILFLIILAIPLFVFSFVFSKFPQKSVSDDVPPELPAVVELPATRLPLKTFTDKKNLFSIEHPINVTEGSSLPDPFVVALELRYKDTVAEFKIGEEKPGWFLRISQLLENTKGKSLVDFAKEARFTEGKKVTETFLAGKSAIRWVSAVYPQTFYLLDTSDGFLFIKSQINGPFLEKHQSTIDAILSTLKLLEKPDDPDLGFHWIRQQFSDFWDIEYPEGWALDKSELAEGKISLKGVYGGSDFQANFSFPVIKKVTLSLGDWLSQDLDYLTPEARRALLVRDVKIKGTTAQAVFNLPDRDGTVVDRLYIWRRAGLSPSSFITRQTSGELNAPKRAELFERFVKGVR